MLIKTGMMEYYFRISTSNDYRQGPKAYVKAYFSMDSLECDEDEDEFYHVVSAILDIKKYTVIIAGGENGIDEEPILQKEFNTLEEADNILIQAYSHINNQSPFVVTGMTCAYKDEGYYGQPVPVTDPDILKMRDNLLIIVGFIVGKSAESSEICKSLSIYPGE